MTTFSLPNPNIILSGQWINLTAGGHEAARIDGQNSRVDVGARGAGLSLFGYVGSGAQLSASVDGGVYVSLMPVADQWAELPIYSGLADAPHSVVVRHMGGARDWYLDRTQAVMVSGSAPALLPPADFGPMISLSTYAAVRREGGWNSSTDGYYSDPPALIQLYPDGAIRFLASCRKLRWWTFHQGKSWRVMRDRTDIGAPVADRNDARWDWLTIATGEDCQEHEYSIYPCDGGDQAAYAYQAMMVDGDIASAAPVVREVMAFYGDSILRAAATGDTQKGAAHRTAAAVGASAANLARSGAWVTHRSANDGCGQCRVVELTGLNPSPGRVVVLYGVNDLLNSVSPGDFRTAYASMIQALSAGLPSARFFCVGILANIYCNSAQRASYASAICGALVDIGLSRALFVDVEGLIDPSQDTSDGIHLNEQGHGKLYRRMLPLMKIEPRKRRL